MSLFCGRRAPCSSPSRPLSSLKPAPPPGAAKLAADVVVSAEAEPESAASLGVAATVIDAAEIAASKATTVLDLLRTVPGLDVVQSGGPGTVTSLFLRGTSSTQTLVLVDGVPLNSPYFGGTDLSALSVANVERVEVVRGPFSALYGSEAIGGVVRIFTRKGAAHEEVSGRATLALGNAAAKEAFGEIAAGLRAADGLRRVPAHAHGRRSSERVLRGDERLRQRHRGSHGRAARGRSSRAATKAGPASRSPPGLATPHRATTNETTTFEAPVSLALSAKSSVEASFRWVKDSPTFSDPDAAFSSSSTDARRAGARLVFTSILGAQRLAAGADWERTLVSNESNFGVALEDASTRTFALFRRGSHRPRGRAARR